MGIRWRILIFINLKKGYAMTENNILQFKNPSEIESGLEKILQEGAIKMLKKAVEAEIDAFLSAHKSRHTEDGYSQQWIFAGTHHSDGLRKPRSSAKSTGSLSHRHKIYFPNPSSLFKKDKEYGRAFALAFISKDFLQETSQKRCRRFWGTIARDYLPARSVA